MKKTLSVLAAFGFVLGMSSMAMAVTASGEMVASATLTNACTVGAATMAFGSSAALVGGAGDTAESTGLMIACTTGYVPLIWSDSARTLSDGTNSFPFSLSHIASGGTTLPALSTTAIAIPGYISNGDDIAVTLYGEILAANFGNKPAGNYTANINVKVEY